MQTQSSAVTSTISVEQLKELPLVSRNALYVVAFLPGVETAGGPRGVDHQRPAEEHHQHHDRRHQHRQPAAVDRRLLLDGHAASRRGRGNHGDGRDAGRGRRAGRGADRVRDPLGHQQVQQQHLPLLPPPDAQHATTTSTRSTASTRTRSIVHQYGGRVGGPIVIPGLFDGRDKAFFFFNFEHLHQPSEATRTRTILNPQARRGHLHLQRHGRRRAAASHREPVQLAAAQRPDVHVRSDDRRRCSTQIAGRHRHHRHDQRRRLARRTRSSIVYQAASTGNQYAPTTRIDFNLTDRHRLTGTLLLAAVPEQAGPAEQRRAAVPGLPEPGLPDVLPDDRLGRPAVDAVVEDGQRGRRPAGSGRRTTSSATSTRTCSQSQGGFGLEFPGPPSRIRRSHNNPAPRNTTELEHRGHAQLAEGRAQPVVGRVVRADHPHPERRERASRSSTIGVDVNNDPADAMFNTTNFPGASTGEPDGRAEHLRGADRAHHGDQRHGAARRRDRQVRLPRQPVRRRRSMNSFDLYAQDSWRVTPTLTLNYGLRWDVQLPFTPVTNTWSTTTLADLCGIVRRRLRSRRTGLQPVPAGHRCRPAPNFVPTYQRFEPGAKPVQDRLEQPRAERRRRVAAERAGRLAAHAPRRSRPGDGARRLLGDLQASSAWTASPACYGGNPGGTTAATRNYTTGLPDRRPGETAPVLFRDRSRARPAGVRRPSRSIRFCGDDGEQRQHVRSEHQDAVRAPVFGRLPALARPRHGVRSPLRRQPQHERLDDGELERRRDDLRERVPRRVQARAGEPARQRGGGAAAAAVRATSGLARARRRCRPTSRTSAALPGVAGAATRPLYTSTNFTNSAWTGHLGYYEPDPEDAANDLHANTTFRSNALHGGPAGELLRDEPGRRPTPTSRGRSRARATTRCSSSCGAGFSQGLLVNGNYTYAKRLGLVAPDACGSTASTSAERPGRAARVQDAVDVRRCRSAAAGGSAADMNRLAERGSSATGSSRAPAACTRSSTTWAACKVVGMSKSELQKNFKIRTVRDRTTGAITVFSFPQDIIDNTRRAFNTDPTSATGYGGDGAPTGRYIAPRQHAGLHRHLRGRLRRAAAGAAARPDRVRAGTCALSKRFPFGREGERRVHRRSAERVRQHQLQPRRRRPAAATASSR